MVDDRDIELAAIRAQRDELHNAVNAYFTASRNEGRVPGMVKRLMEQLALRTVDVKVVPDLYQYITLCGGLEEFGGLPIISLQSAPLDGWNRVGKRAFDILFSLLAILVSGPVMFTRSRSNGAARTTPGRAYIR